MGTQNDRTTIAQAVPDRKQLIHMGIFFKPEENA
jgi:hypothetical protein